MSFIRKYWWLFAFVAAVALAASCFVVLSRESQRPVAPKSACTAREEPVPVEAPLTKEEEFSKKLRSCSVPEERVLLMRSLLQEPWAKSSFHELRDAILADESPAVREAAFSVAHTLAVREGRAATVAVVGAGIDSPHAEVRRAGLRECKNTVEYGFIPRLIEIADGNASDRFLAIDALACCQDERAQKRVLAAAMNEKLPANERARAIVLLSKSHLPEAFDYLKSLVEGQDAALKELALSTLAAKQANASK